MEIDNLDDYKDHIYRLLNIFEDFEDALQSGTTNEQVLDFIREDLCEVYETFNFLREDIGKISLPKKPYAKKQETFKEKIVAFLYSNLIPFCMTDKIKGIPISRKFIANIIAILDNTRCIHHSHTTGDIIGYADTFCNERVRENYYKIPVIAHNLFSFDFFFLAKGLRASVWKTRDICIGGKNPTDINLASIDNQVQFIDKFKYFQQSLGALANSVTCSEKTAIYKQSKKYLMQNPKISKNFLALNKTDQEWDLTIFQQEKERYRLIRCKNYNLFEFFD